MEILVCKTSGFCFGVKNAILKTEEILKNKNKAYCLGELIHNIYVNLNLEKKGLKIVNDLTDVNGDLIIRAHGIAKEIYERIKKSNLNIHDLTCPNVLNIHNQVSKYSKNNFYIFLVGKKNHPETLGTISFCGNNSSIIENIDDIDDSIEKLKHSKLNNLLIISQTTFSLDKFNEYTKIIKEKLSKINIEVKNTICNTTKLRQEEVIELSKKVDMMIIIGGRNSSNTNKLYELAKIYCPISILIETEEEIDIKKVKKYSKIGIMAGASTPIEIVNNVVNLLKRIN